MKYTLKKIAGILCIALALFVAARFMPIALWYVIIVALVGAISYLLYYCFCS